MKNFFRSLIAIIITATIGVVSYFVFFPSTSQYKKIDWETYEHTDKYDSRYYLLLDKKGKVAYENIMGNYKNFPEKIEIPELNDDELTEVFTAVLYDNPLLFCFDNTCNILTDTSASYFMPKYTMSESEYKKKLDEIDKLTPAILENLPSDQFEAELYLHDFLIDRCTYTNTDTRHERDIYGSLILGQASCEGYSRAIKYLFDLCNIENYVLFGLAETDDGQKNNHMWNIVTIDGKKYHLDSTWNDTLSRNDANPGHQYMYFNITDEEINKTHSDFVTDDKCTALEANYYIRKNLYFSAFGEEEKAELTKIITDAVKNNVPSLGLKFETDTLFNNAKHDLVDKQEIFIILSGAAKKSGKTVNTEKFFYRAVDEVRVLEIMINLE